jgi:DNA-binding transcriptional regulator/RsmH inhibitor MraZ
LHPPLFHGYNLLWPKVARFGQKVDSEVAQTPNSPAQPPTGRFSGKLDDKGRLKFPVPFQAYLSSFADKGLFVTSIDRTTAQIYPIANWRSNLKLLQEQNHLQDEVEIVLFNAQDLGADAEMDNQGRVTFNTDLRRELDLDGQNVHFYVEAGHILLFTEAIYQQKRQEAVARTKPAIKLVKGAGLQ